MTLQCHLHSLQENFNLFLMQICSSDLDLTKNYMKSLAGLENL